MPAPHPFVEIARENVLRHPLGLGIVALARSGIAVRRGSLPGEP